jgi:PPOX class probable F420-dependent enzyme
MADGSPQTTETWVDTDGEHVIIHTVQTHQKMRNIRRDPRVSLAVCDADEPSRYYAVRGRVSNITTDGGAEHRRSTFRQESANRPIDCVA